MPIQTLQTFLHSRKGAVLVAEQALEAACAAFANDAGQADADLNMALQQAEQALYAAGWQHAVRFNRALLMAVQFIADNEANGVAFEAALNAFTTALCHRNLGELACSTQLLEHYRTLSANAHPKSPSSISFDAFALADRLVPSALLHTRLKAKQIARLRERYEDALLTVLRTSASAACSTTEAALDELHVCLAALADASPYNIWHLASVCSSAQRQSGYAYDDDAKRLYASFNLLFKAQIEVQQGGGGVPLSVINTATRASVALLWRAFAIEGAAADDGEAVQLLRDYGISVAWRLIDLNQVQAADYAEGAQLLYDAGSSETQQIGALTITRSAYEDFLTRAELSNATLAKYTEAVIASDTPQAGLALQASEAAYRLANLASQIGLAELAWLTDMLGLAWRRYAYAVAQLVEAPSKDLYDLAILQEGSKMLEEKLQQLTSGSLPDEVPTDYCAALTKFIEPTHC